MTTRNADAIYKALFRAQRSLPGAMADATDQVATDVRESVSVPGGGVHAAPGQAPRLQSGELAESIQGKSKGTSGTVSAGAEHAEYQEFGTTEMEPRPFFAEGVRRSANKHLPDKVGKAIVDAQRRGYRR